MSIFVLQDLFLFFVFVVTVYQLVNKYLLPMMKGSFSDQQIQLSTRDELVKSLERAEFDKITELNRREQHYIDLKDKVDVWTVNIVQRRVEKQRLALTRMHEFSQYRKKSAIFLQQQKEKDQQNQLLKAGLNKVISEEFSDAKKHLVTKLIMEKFIARGLKL